MMHTATPSAQSNAMRGYYQWHAAIYDATRWTFLLGRNEILRRLPISDSEQQVLLEVGCGTGRNLRRLAQRHSKLQLIGVDVSPDMLARARKATADHVQRVRLLEQPYGVDTSLSLTQTPDFVLFSYALTMFNPGWEAAIEQAWRDLPEGGRLAVVDFHSTPSQAFRWWMSKNHVRMDGHLLPFLREKFDTELEVVRPAWLAGLWQYFLWTGVKRGENFTQT